jgi:hypothetical protein
VRHGLCFGQFRLAFLKAIDDALQALRALPDAFLGGRPGAHHDPGGHGDDGQRRKLCDPRKRHGLRGR